MDNVVISFGPWAQRIAWAIGGLIFYIYFPLVILMLFDSWPLFWLSLLGCAAAWVYVVEWKKTHPGQ